MSMTCQKAPCKGSSCNSSLQTGSQQCGLVVQFVVTALRCNVQHWTEASRACLAQERFCGKALRWPPSSFISPCESLEHACAKAFLSLWRALILRICGKSHVCVVCAASCRFTSTALTTARTEAHGANAPGCLQARFRCTQWSDTARAGRAFAAAVASLMLACWPMSQLHVSGRPVRIHQACVDVSVLLS